MSAMKWIWKSHHILTHVPRKLCSVHCAVARLSVRQWMNLNEGPWMGLKLRTVHGDSTVHAVVVRIKQPPRNPQLHIFIRDRTTALWVLMWPIFFAYLWCPLSFKVFFWSVLPSFAFLACLPLSFSVFYLIEFCKYIHCALAAITTTLT